MPLTKEKERANHVGTMPTCFTSEHHPEEKKEEEEVGEEMEFWIQSFGSIDFLGRNLSHDVLDFFGNNTCTQLFNYSL